MVEWRSNENEKPHSYIVYFQSVEPNVEMENNIILAYESVTYPNCIYKIENENLPYKFYIGYNDTIIIDVFPSEDAEETLYSHVFKYKDGIFIPEEE